MSENFLLEYCSAIESGRINVNEKVRKVYGKLSQDIKRPRSPWIYDNEKAKHAVEFIEKYCKHSKGKWDGQPMLLELWQKALLSAAFGFVHKDTGVRKYREVFLTVGRKNGKSTLGAAVGLYLLLADGEPGAEVYAVATKKDQAKIVWLESKRMINKSPALSKRLKCLVSEIVGTKNDVVFRPLGSDSDTLDGLNVHGAVMDEIHAWKDANLYDVIYDGMGAREQPLLLEITTMGTIREGVFDNKYAYAEKVIDGIDGFNDETLLPIIYELDNRGEWTDPTNWVKANPGLGTIKSLEMLTNKVKRARADPTQLKNLLCKDLNVRETNSEAWLSFDELNNPAVFDIFKLKPKYGIGGTDLSQTTDLTAAKTLFMVPDDQIIYVLQMYWIPEELLEQRVKEDRIPYDIWRDRGLLRSTPGNKINPHYVTEWFIELRDEYDLYLTWIGYDRWSATMWAAEMKDHFGAEAMVEVVQGKKTLSGPMYSLKADLSAKTINYNNNPIDKWCLSNVAIDIDKNLNIQPCKTKNQRMRIDGAAALLDAYVVLQDKYSDYMNMI